MNKSTPLDYGFGLVYYYSKLSDYIEKAYPLDYLLLMHKSVQS